MYPELMLIPMREELTKAGVQELRTGAEVDRAVSAPGTTMIIVNSVCGCAAGRMRPAVRMAMQHGTRPDHVYSVFAGQDREATDRARSYFTGYPPVLALDRNPARRQARLHAAASSDRDAGGGRHCRGSD